MSTSDGAYLTPADQAEIDLLWFEFIEAMETHSRRCSHCRVGWLEYELERDGESCPEFGDVVGAILAYRRHLIVRNKAFALRGEQARMEARCESDSHSLSLSL